MVRNINLMPVLKNGWIPIDTLGKKQVPETNIITIVAMTILTGGIFLFFWLPGWISNRKTLKAQEIKIAPATSAKVTDPFNAFQTAWETVLKINKSLAKDKNDKKIQAIIIAKTKLKEYTKAAEKAQGALSDDVDVDRNTETSKRAADHFEYLAAAVANEADEDKELIQGLIIAAQIAFNDVVKSYLKIDTANQKNKKALMNPRNIYSPHDIAPLRTIFCSTSNAHLSATHDIRRAERALRKIETKLHLAESQNASSIYSQRLCYSAYIALISLELLTWGVISILLSAYHLIFHQSQIATSVAWFHSFRVTSRYRFLCKNSESGIAWKNIPLSAWSFDFWGRDFAFQCIAEIEANLQQVSKIE